MSKRRNSLDSDRRNFLKGAGLVGAAALTPIAAGAQVSAPKQKLKASVPGPKQIAVETHPPSKDPVNQTSSGGDFMVDVLKTLNIDYLAMNCASAFRGRDKVRSHLRVPLKVRITFQSCDRRC
jgi:acetolactate synthase-1/2/3 large subunit